MSVDGDGLARSVQAKLSRHAKAIGTDPNLVLTRLEPDAMTYLADTIRVEPIRFEDAYGGSRITLRARLGAAQLRVQVDVGIGDIVVPPPTWLEYPSLLDLPRPRLRAYSRETVIAEKLHAMVILGSRNSRLKDYFDLQALARKGVPDAGRMGAAIAATFERRKTAVPDTWPVGLTDEFARDAGKVTQWNAFLGKNRLDAPALDTVIKDIREFVAEPLELARHKRGTP